MTVLEFDTSVVATAEDGRAVLVFFIRSGDVVQVILRGSRSAATALLQNLATVLEPDDE